MKRSVPLKPDGDSAFAVFCRWVWDLLAGGKFPITGAGGARVEYINGVYVVTAAPTVSAGKGSSFKFTGEWDPGRIYKSDKDGSDLAIISLGANAGTYVFVNSSPTSGHAPYAGGGFWVQLPMGGLGSWI